MDPVGPFAQYIAAEVVDTCCMPKHNQCESTEACFDLVHLEGADFASENDHGRVGCPVIGADLELLSELLIGHFVGYERWHFSGSFSMRHGLVG